MTLAENLGERGDQPPPPPPVPPQDRLTPQIPDELKRQYSLKDKAINVVAALIVAVTSHADEKPSPEPNPAKQEYVARANDKVPAKDLPDLARQEYVAPANDKVPSEDLPGLAVGILEKTGKVASAIGGDAKDKADALDDAERLAADRNENAPEIEFRREDLDRSQDEDK